MKKRLMKKYLIHGNDYIRKKMCHKYGYDWYKDFDDALKNWKCKPSTFKPGITFFPRMMCGRHKIMGSRHENI